MHPTLLIPLLPCKSIALTGEAAETCLAVGCVFLAVDRRAAIVEEDVAAAEVVANLVHHGWGPVLRERRANTHERNPALVVHDVQRIVLSRCATLDRKVMLKYAININRHLNLPSLVTHQFL